MEQVKTYDLGYAIVRIHPSKRTEEEQRALWEQSAREFYKAIKTSKKEEVRNVI